MYAKALPDLVNWPRLPFKLFDITTNNSPGSLFSWRRPPADNLDLHPQTHHPNSALPRRLPQRLRQTRMESPRRARLRRLRRPHLPRNSRPLPRRLQSPRRRQIQLPLPRRRIIPRRRHPSRTHNHGTRTQREHHNRHAPSRAEMYICVLHERAAGAESVDGSAAAYAD